MMICKDEQFREVQNFFSSYISNQEYLQENNSLDHVNSAFSL